MFSERLRQKSASIAERWLTAALAAYPADSAAAFRRQRDPFANPVGHALRTGTRAAVDALLEGRTSEEICSHLDDVLKMRAVQELQPSQAIGFVFSLKEAVRGELRSDGSTLECGDSSPPLASELAELDRCIDRVALAAFDLYTRYRGQICELRINEVKRNVAEIARRMGRCGPWEPRENELNNPSGTDCQSVPDNSDGLPIRPTGNCPEAERGGSR